MWPKPWGGPWGTPGNNSGGWHTYHQSLAKQHKICEKLLEKAYCKYNNISDFEFCIGGEIPYIKINFFDTRFNEFVTIIMAHNF